MINRSSLLIILLICANLLFSCIIYFNYQNKKNVNELSQIRTEKFISKTLINDSLMEFRKQNHNKEIVLGIISPKAKTCFIENLLAELKQNVKQRKMAIAFLPSNFTKQEMKNFKQNFNINFEVRKMNKDVSKEWEKSFKENQIDGAFVAINEDEIRIF